MKFKEVAKAYKKTEMFGAVEARDPETVVIGYGRIDQISKIFS